MRPFNAINAIHLIIMYIWIMDKLASVIDFKTLIYLRKNGLKKNDMQRLIEWSRSL